MYKNLFKRIIDVLLAFVGLLILSPLFFLVALILLFTNKGSSPFFFQNRPGKNEKIFKIIKFKSMSDERDINNKLLPDDQRITLFGNFIRKYSLDEIPQLINVLIGDMSLVGPRPLRVRYLSFYTETERTRHLVKPGITGLAQISGRNSLNWDDKLALDVIYVKKMSLYLDIKIILKTVLKVINGSDANLSENIIDLDIYRNIKQQNV
ncbi:sugar transferase [Tamlana sp. 2201CG12-4]|uniref:sugar transferase n=1 Tax=Tamlana sp. 2201CG12-4 TaxID=3112582 RepID=UPI002DB5DE63|nr:sugar transferase [Tamlana sp. 2201CG12-4]MEC3908019.1 sugar transferase [Tamlana sp. 2201CG12-4]